MSLGTGPTEVEMSADIRDLSRECDEIFRSVCQAHGAQSHAVVEVLHQQFEQWTSNLSVFAKPHLSLDASLQYSESLRKLVLQLLQLIRRNLERIERLENERDDHNPGTHEPESAIVTQMSQWFSAELSSLLVESLKALESGVDSLLRLGVAIQQASAGTLTQRINDFIEKKDDGTLEDMVYLHLKHRLVVRAQEQDSTQGAALSLCRQLAASISFRYFGIIYRRSHHAKKSDTRAIEADAALATGNEQRVSKPVLQHRIQETRQTFATKGKSILQAPHLRNDVPPSDTTPSTPDSKIAQQIYIAPPKSFFGAKSIISVRAPEGVRYPRAPKVVSPETSALCPFCCNSHDSGLLENKEWWECVSLMPTEQSPVSRKTRIEILTRHRKHVDQELRLYTCISEECIEPPQIFARFEEWKQHMDTEHSRQWMCDVHLPFNWYCSMEHDEQHFEDEVAFEKHVESHHPEYNGELELDGFKDWCAVKLPRPAFTCPVCNTIPEKLANVLRVDSEGIPTVNHDNEDAHNELLRHIAQHLKQVGFISADYLQEDDVIGFSVTDDQSNKELPDDSCIHGEWEPFVSSYFDDDYKDYSPDSEHLGEDAEEWTWFAKQKVDIVCDWASGIVISELLDCDDPEHAVRERLKFTTALRGEKHPHRIHCLFALTIVLAYHEQYAEARTTLSDALELCTSISIVDESMTASLLKRLNVVLRSLDGEGVWEIITQNVKNIPHFFSIDETKDIRRNSQSSSPFKDLLTDFSTFEDMTTDVLSFGNWEDTQQNIEPLDEIAIEKKQRLEDILTWIGSDDNYGIRSSLLKERDSYPGVGDWIFRCAGFQEWFDPQDATESPILWLKGIMGSGKSTLAAIIVEQASLLTSKPMVLPFFCRANDLASDNFVALGRDMLARILRWQYHDDELLFVLHQEYLRDGQTILSSPVLIEELLTLALRKCGSAYIILDGLDECPREQRGIITKFFRQLIENLPDEMAGTLRCLFTSRDDGAARSDFAGLPSFKITFDDNHSAINLCCNLRVKSFDFEFMLPKGKARQIVETVAWSARGQILLARLWMDHIDKSATISDLNRRCELDRLPQDIRRAYDRMMTDFYDKNPQTSKEDGLRVLRWLACAKRPLHWREIQVMNSIDRERQRISPERQHIMQPPKDLFGSLVDMSGGDRLQLFHPSFKSYLIESGYVLPRKEEQNLADLCMSYLNLPAFVHPPTREGVLSGDYGFMDYAVPFWLQHLEEGVTFQEGEEEEIMSSLTETLGSFIDLHWKPHSTATPIEQHSNKLQCFRTLPFYDQLEQAAASTREQLRNFQTEENALSIMRTVYDVRKILESIASDSDGNDRRTIEEKYGTKIFKCPRFKCDYFSTGLRSAKLRKNHMDKHNRPFTCLIKNCTLGEASFTSNKDLERHRSAYHGEAGNIQFRNPSRRDATRETLEPTPGHSPLTTPAHSPRLRPYAGLELPILKNAELTYTPALAPMEPHFGENLSPYRRQRSTAGRNTRGVTSLVDIINRPDDSRRLPMPQEPEVDFQDFLALGNSYSSSGRSSITTSSLSEADSGVDQEEGPRLKRVRQTELKCPHCNSVYEKRDDLKSHLLSHDPQRSHLCEVCHKGFTRAADLKRHSYTHTDDRNFVCRGLLKDGTTWGCGRSFARTDALKKHHESRTGRACILPYLQEQERAPSRSQA